MHSSSRRKAAWEPSLIRFRAKFHIPIKSTPIFPSSISLHHGKLPSKPQCFPFCVQVKNGGGAFPGPPKGGPSTPQGYSKLHADSHRHHRSHTVSFAGPGDDHFPSIQPLFPIEQSFSVQCLKALTFPRQLTITFIFRCASHVHLAAIQ